MNRCYWYAFIWIGIAALPASARAEQGAPPGGAPEDPYAPGAVLGPAAAPAPDSAAEPAEDGEPKEPKRGDFDAGGQVRLPSGPDEDGQFATFNFVALDLKGRYYLLDSVSVTGNIPVAVVNPGPIMGGPDPKMFGGISTSFEIKAPKMPFGPKAEDTQSSLLLTGAYMREGAMLLSEKDYPLFFGDFKFGFGAGVNAVVKLGEFVDFSLAPLYIHQAGTDEAIDAVQIPMSLILALGSLVKVSADLGIFTGDDFSFRGRNGGRIYAGGALDVKIGPILAHAGAGVASLQTGGLYPSIRDSVYIDLNVKYAK
jgi:hypothetical protein